MPVAWCDHLKSTACDYGTVCDFTIYNYPEALPLEKIVARTMLNFLFFILCWYDRVLIARIRLHSRWNVKIKQRLLRVKATYIKHDNNSFCNLCGFPGAYNIFAPEGKVSWVEHDM
jgi:hypothetical protein